MEDRTTAIADLFADARQQRSPSDSSTAPRSPFPLSLDTAALLEIHSQTVDAPPPVAFFGVYDGHGGTAVAEALQQDLHHLIVKNGLQGDPKQALEQACLEMDKACLARDHELSAPPPGTSEDAEDQPRRQSLLTKMELSGATAAMALVLRGRDDACVRVYAANVGDSRVVLSCGGEALDLTRDHTFTHAAEKERVKTAGGVISRGRLNGVLEVTRSFGDIKCKTYPPPEGTHLWGDKQSLVAKPDIEEVICFVLH
ncbi:phosphatase 2C-like domain-containing protein [Tribonema minus]|uniref:Phosphatase 2C-like domain-containing protein n=1 Tax=Tribonema minus TaxID=303371 RepID=A0A836CA24_9STRA|nr:phosphatase 2C-like domain-containing protein [Tribonema minus]